MKAPRDDEEVQVSAAGRLISVRAGVWQDLRYSLPRPCTAEQRDAHAQEQIEAIARETNPLQDDELLQRFRAAKPRSPVIDVVGDELERRGLRA